MITSVYVVSPSDNVKNFASSARELEYEGRTVLVGKVERDVRTVVFAEGAPHALKRAIVNGGAFDAELDVFRTHIIDMLSALRISCDILRVFVHFGGQGEDEVRKFNDSLGQVSTESDSSPFYAISFGNHLPDVLFPNGIFTPPYGKSFDEMCNGLRHEAREDFEHIRALRLLLSCASPNDKGEYDVGEAWRQLWDLGVPKLSDREKHYFMDYSTQTNLLCVNNGYISFEKTIISAEEFALLLSFLEREEKNYDNQ